jgi:hypothetical protein
MIRTPYFTNGLFISPDGEIIEVTFENDMFKLSFVNEKRQIEICNTACGWWFTNGYSLRKNGNDIELAKDNSMDGNSVIYNRISMG